MTTRTSLRILARGLGWFSIALGTAELLRPQAAARFTGITAPPRLVQACGTREVVTGLGLLPLALGAGVLALTSMTPDARAAGDHVANQAVTDSQLVGNQSHIDGHIVHRVGCIGFDSANGFVFAICVARWLTRRASTALFAVTLFAGPCGISSSSPNRTTS